MKKDNLKKNEFNKERYSTKNSRNNKDTYSRKSERGFKEENPRKTERGYKEEYTRKTERGHKEEYTRKTVVENKENNDSGREDIIEGRNAVMEALKGDTTIEYLLVSKGSKEGSIKAILNMAKEKKIVIKEVERIKLDSISNNQLHQGVIAKITPYKYFEISDILKTAKERGEKPFIIILDELEDPHNFGAIIRTAEVCGAHGIIIPKRRNVGVTSTVYKSAAGAVEHMKIVKVTNINAAIDELKKNNIWVYGADMDGESYCYETELTSALALVIGSEGKGISKLTKEKCDVVVKIPMVGKITSLNASVAAGMLMYEILKQRIK